jgi:lipopolysaccharide assembly outer membrane protein LptD (OstA)
MVALGTNLNPKGQESDVASKEKIAKSNLSEADKQYFLNDPNNYVDFSIPWNLRINYSLSYTNNTSNPNDIKQTLQFSGDLSLSEQWKIQFNSGYDFEAKKLTQTNLKIMRDLHCWTMSLDWTPFGYYTSYNFRINVKSSVLQDLKMERRKNFIDNF